MRRYRLFKLFSLILMPAGGFLTAQSLEWQAVRALVLENHPLARQADLLRDQASASVVRARGGFDPKTFAAYTNKNFNGKKYFEYAEAGVKLPTWAGVELKGAYNYAAGTYLNPEHQLPDKGQASFGLEWSLAQGLIFDERRAAMQLARIGTGMNASEREALQNDLLLESAKAYWSWAFAQQSVQIMERALQQAQLRHNGLAESFRQGDKAAIDTLESFIQVQNRVVDLQFARTEAQNAATGLSVFLWDAGQQSIAPEKLPPGPDLFLMSTGLEAAITAEELVQQARSKHPEILFYQAKLRQLAVERRLKNEKKKPVVNLSYYLLGNGWEFFPGSSASGAGVLVNDIKWGLDISYPLFNRKARGDYQLAQIKITQTELELQQKIRSIEAKVRQYVNELRNLREQALLFRDMTAGFQRLLEAENEKFRQGESSVFLINTREQRWLDAQLKWLKLLAELHKTEAGLQWAIGALAK